MLVFLISYPTPSSVSLSLASKLVVLPRHICVIAEAPPEVTHLPDPHAQYGLLRRMCSTYPGYKLADRAMDSASAANDCFSK